MSDLEVQWHITNTEGYKTSINIFQQFWDLSHIGKVLNVSVIILSGHEVIGLCFTSSIGP